MDFSFRHYVVTMSSLCYLHVIIVVLFNFFLGTRAYASWWLLGELQALSAFEPHICPNMPLSPEQRILCERSPRVMASIRDGAVKGIDECKYQFRNERWNCSTTGKWQHVFGKVMQRGSREAAFVHAITSAGVTYAVTQACSLGVLPDCSCDRKKVGKGPDGSFEWGGCSDDVKYGMEFAQNFIDAVEIGRHDARANMNRHNNRAGRRAVKRILKPHCKCHGPTQSCPTRTCWQQLLDFREAGSYLKEQYNKAVHVTVRQEGSEMSLIPVKGANKRLGKNELVFLTSSPNYCVKNNETGSLGTSGRECNKTSTGADSCENLCCGRGYDTTRVTRVFQCKCKFHWCCEVRCERCEVTSDVHTCKTEKGKERKGRGRKGRGRKRRGRRRKPKEVLRTKRSVFVEEDFDLDRWMDGDPHESRAENNDETTWWPEQSKVSVINGRPRLNEEILKLYNEWRAIRQKTALKTKYAANPISSWWRNVLDYFKFWLQ
ncbi:protein Wnt-2b-A-like [Clavelina lepadiformis]|uniref:protein Wnt-2b-A-like n=1 Tax=Clavelina lepadiformis TaxID=159417 RepID=UPI0040431C40